MANEQQQEANDSSGNVCSVHGKAHEYNVQCRKDPQWTSIYQYRQACACGDVLNDWHH